MHPGENGFAYDAVIGLGANVGDRRATLERALLSLSRIATVRGVSRVYETPPLGPPQPDFLNAAVRLRTKVTPQELLKQLLQIERAEGRERSLRWGPRTLDLDILWIRDVVIQTPELTVPHPGLVVRAFALRPLLDVAPEATDPASGVAYADILSTVDTRGLRQVDDLRAPSAAGSPESDA